MVESVVPREEIDYSTLYKSSLNGDTLLPLHCYDSRVGVAPRGRLPFAPEVSGYSWTSRLERAREELPRAVFRPTRPKLFKRTASGDGGSGGNQNVTVLQLEVPTKRGRGRPKKVSTVLVDAASVNRSAFYVKRTYKVNEAEDPGTSVGIHTIENYTLHGHGGADVNVGQIGIVRPERHYIRKNGISRPDYCEYDLDDQDAEWLKLVKLSDPISSGLDENVMERVIEELELGWNVLTRPLRKLQQRKEAAMFPDEVPCEICGECDTSNCNVIVLCDDCDLAVHQECYGIAHIPEGPWLCRPCSEKKSSACEFKAKCMLCPWPAGALRKTTDHRWVHSLCAYLVPETAMTFSPSDPYDLVDVCSLQSDRAKLRCVLCRGDPKSENPHNGYPVQCNSKMCHVAFHPMCARDVGWTVDYTHQRSYCNKHTPEDDLPQESETSTEEPKLKLRLNLSQTTTTNPAQSPTKSKYPNVIIRENCPLHVTRGGEKLRIPTFAPKVLIDNVTENDSVFRASDIPVALRRSIVCKLAKYWILKRESRRGTPLLKSLQLDAGWSQTDEMSETVFLREWNEKINLIRSLSDLKKKLSLVRRRELAKLESFAASIEIFEILSSPFTKILGNLISKLQRDVDGPGYFAHPVPCDLFPDYPLIVSYPMDFSSIMANLKSDLCEDKSELFYPSLLHFYADLKLIWENSRHYNTRTSVFYQAADRLEVYSKSLLKEIWDKFKQFGIRGPFDILNMDVKDSANIEDFYFDFDELICGELPESTPARFPKTMNTSILNNGTTKGDNVHMKRRGRPPKKRDGVLSSNLMETEGSESIESISSEGIVIVTPVVDKPNIVKRNYSRKVNTSGVPRKRGRPRKYKPEEAEAGKAEIDHDSNSNPKSKSKSKAECEVQEKEIQDNININSVNDNSNYNDDLFNHYLDSSRGSTPPPPPVQVDLTHLVWVKQSGTEHWCPGEVLLLNGKEVAVSSEDHSSTKRTRRITETEEDLVRVRLFDNTGNVKNVTRDNLKPLSLDFERDMEGLKMDGIVSWKFLSSAHRAALKSKSNK